MTAVFPQGLHQPTGDNPDITRVTRQISVYARVHSTSNFQLYVGPKPKGNGSLLEGARRGHNHHGRAPVPQETGASLFVIPPVSRNLE